MSWVCSFLQSIMADCNICSKRVLNHSFYLNCQVCCSKVHLKCLSQVSKNDSIFKNRDTDIWYCTKCMGSILPFNNIDDDHEYNRIIYDLQCKNNPIPYDLLASGDKIFSPLELNDDASSPLGDKDPDLQFYNDQFRSVLQSCDYYIEDSLNQKLSVLDIPHRSFSLIHSNVRSAQKNLKKLELYLTNLNIQFPIVALTETWLQDHNFLRFGIPGFAAEHNYRTKRSGGGVSLLIKHDIEYTVRNDLLFQNDVLETLFIEIDKKEFDKEKNILIGVIYRPPGTDINVFNTSIEAILTKIKSEKKLAYLSGDYNIDLLNIDNHNSNQG